jgi:hypothetical protein
MKLNDARKAMTFYPLATPQQRARQAVAWAKSVAIIGDKILTNTKVQRLDKPRYA